MSSSSPSKSSPAKKTTKPSVKSTVTGSPTKDKQSREAKRIALEALFDLGVKGEGMRMIAEKVRCIRSRVHDVGAYHDFNANVQSGLSNQQVGDLFRPKRQNMRSKALSVFDSGGL